jgi:hypothetical protein
MINIKNIFKQVILQFFSALKKDRKSKIIFYHDIHLEKLEYTSMSTPITTFEKHILEIRKNGFRIVRKIDQPINQIQICFDDGFKGIYDNKDFFINESIFPTVFLAVKLIGLPGYLNENEILELQALGFNFESHAYSHENLTAFSDDNLRFELEESKLYLERLLNKKITEICFPIGYFSNRVYLFAKQTGYKLMHSSIPGNYFQEDWNGIVNRNLVQFCNAKQVKCIIFGALIPFRKYYKKRQFLREM